MIMFKYFRYVNINSIIHALNPLFKLLITICYIVSVFLAKSLMAYLFLMTFLLIILIFSYIPDNKYYKFIYDYKFLILTILILDLILNFSLKSLVLTLISTIFALLMLGTFIFTTKPKEIFVCIEKILLPLKLFGVNTKKLAFKLIILFIYKPIFIENKELLNKETKNLDLKLKFFDKIKIIHNNTMAKINNLNDTIIVRNYFVYKKEKVTIKIQDYLFAITEFILLIAIILRG